MFVCVCVSVRETQIRVIDASAFTAVSVRVKFILNTLF
jgi:bacterioferritin-associated ferredoxin